MPHKPQSNFSLTGFSLAEVLIALAIMGILAAFTIPKLFQTPHSTLGSKQSARAKDVAFMIVNAYEQYRTANGTVATTVSATHLTPYMNYVSMDSASTNNVDNHPGSGSSFCSVGTPCLQLHHGGKMRLMSQQFAGSNTTNCIQFIFDPDGVASGSTADSYSKSVQFELYYDGTITTRGMAKTNTCHSDGCFGPGAHDPSWFTGF